ncbi:MAG TPA: kelch repeat-containing protein, partial [Burkholderiales bacterium]|nr:kelch repeat-containing protein [Burkholderiales bacterium]
LNTNAPLDPNAVNPVAGSNPDIANNSFVASDLLNLDYSDVTFTIRNRGNADTTLALKLALRDAICPTDVTQPCAPPTGWKLQLVLRKVAFTPTAIPTTGNDLVSSFGADSLKLAWQIGLAQANAQVSNIGVPTLVNLRNPNLGVFNPTDPNAATLPLSPGESAYGTLRVIRDSACVAPSCVPVPSDPLQLLQFGVKMAAIDASNKTGTPKPLIIETLSLPVMTALSPTVIDLRTFGGARAITGSVTWTDITDPSHPITLQTSPITGLPDVGQPISFAPLCPTITVTCTDANTSIYVPSTNNGAVTPQQKGTFRMLLTVTDASKPQQQDQQQYDIVVNGAAQDPTAMTPPDGGLTSPTLVYNTTTSLGATSPGSRLPVVFSLTSGPCSIVPAGGTYLLSTSPNAVAGDTCTIGITLPGDAQYATFTKADWKTVTVAAADQMISFDNTPPYQALSFSMAFGTTKAIKVTSTSGNAVTLAVAGSPSPCQLSAAPSPGATGAFTYTVSTIAQGGPLPKDCTLTATVAGTNQYNALTGQAVPGQITVNLGTPTASFVWQPTPQPYYNGTVAVAAYSANPSPTPTTPYTVTQSTGTRSLSVSNSTGCGVASSSGPISLLGPGTCNVTATWASDGYWDTVSAPVGFLIKGAVTYAISISPTSSIIYGDATPTFTLSVTGSNGLDPAKCVGIGTPTIGGQPSSNPADAGTYSMVVTGVSSTTTCDVSTSGATLTVSKATPVFSGLSGSYVFPAGSTAAILSGTLNRQTASGSPKAFVFPGSADGVTGTNTSAFTVAVNKGTTTIKTYTPTTSDPGTPLGGSSAGTFSVTDTTPALTPDNYTLNFAYAGGGNFNPVASPLPTATLRVEGFANTGNMVQARSAHTSTLLNDGRVLLAGGFDGTGSPSATAEVYCPDTMSNPTSAQCPKGVNNFAAVGSLPSKSAGHTATLLTTLAPGSACQPVPPQVPANWCGKVLVVGGGNSSAELFDPNTNQWSPAGGASVRSYHTATLLPDGKVFVAGGVDNSGKTIQTTMIYNPAAGTWSNGATLNVARERHTAVLLSNGMVLIAGGRNKSGNAYQVVSSTELWNPAAPTATPGTGPAMANARFSHSMVTLRDGNHVLVAGGSADGTTNVTGSLNASEILTVNGGTLSWAAVTAPGLQTARREFTLTALADGRALAVAGLGSGAGLPRLSSSDVLSANAFSAGASLAPLPTSPTDPSRSGHAATRLCSDAAMMAGTCKDGRVLVTGGTNSAGASMTSAELYTSPNSP